MMYIFAILINHETRSVISVKISCGGLRFKYQFWERWKIYKPHHGYRSFYRS